MCGKCTCGSRHAGLKVITIEVETALSGWNGSACGMESPRVKKSSSGWLGWAMLAPAYEWAFTALAGNNQWALAPHVLSGWRWRAPASPRLIPQFGARGFFLGLADRLPAFPIRCQPFPMIFLAQTDHRIKDNFILNHLKDCSRYSRESPPAWLACRPMRSDAGLILRSPEEIDMERVIPYK